MKRRIAVIGDVHGNLRALRAAYAAALAENCDEFVLLGDLLTYGLDTVGVIDEVGMILSRHKTHLLRGNHDAMYLTSDDNSVKKYEEKLPAWLRESISYTRAMLPREAFLSLPFVDYYRTDGLYFAHANPFGVGDWRYIRSEEDYIEVLDELGANSVLAGFFGHTHRPCIGYRNGDNILCSKVVPLRPMLLSPRQAPYCINVGSVGQPRDSSGKIYIVAIESEGEIANFKFVEVSYDVSNFVSELSSSGLTVGTRIELIKYFL